MRKTKRITKSTKPPLKGLRKKATKSRTESLKRKLSVYGIGVDDVKAKARLLEKVLKDLKNREFLKQPGVKRLVDKVTKKTVATSNVEAQKLAAKTPRPKRSAKEAAKRESLFMAFSETRAQQLGASVAHAIMRRVDDVRRTLTTTRRRK